MSDSKAWSNEWLKAQQKLVESWSDMAREDGPATTTNAADSWSHGFDLWRKQSTPPSADTGLVIDKCMDIGRGYFSMAEQIGKKVSSGGKPQDVIKQLIGQLKSAAQQHADPWSPSQNQPGHDFMSQWASPSASWQKLAAAIMPLKYPEAKPSTHGSDENYDQLGQLLSASGIGFFRESQEQHQQGVKLALEYFKSSHEFDLALLRVSIESLESFHEKMSAADKNKETRPTSSLRALYDLWVDTSEEHYANFAIGPEYQSLYGDMVNKLMALKKHYSDVIDDFLQSMNLPSRRELDTLEQRVHQLGRENHGLRSELKEIRALLGGRQTTQSSTKKKKPVKKK
ncbi:MAG: class III poly(R)-hydroxyalkanoic acid synthase subunit PhaE [Gammaproteobacteria bacterium]|nr:class III poly(R)-hydroxyalkanoic acid synthase subunit PhaE [Gammaproteobacteria bacterium]